MTQETRLRLDKEIVAYLRELIFLSQDYGLRAIRLTRELYDVAFRHCERWRERYEFDLLAPGPLSLSAGGECIPLIPDCERLELVMRSA